MNSSTYKSHSEPWVKNEKMIRFLAVLIQNEKKKKKASIVVDHAVSKTGPGLLSVSME